VTAQTVSAWRKALGVPQVNEGTERLYRDYAPERLPPEVQEKGWVLANSPENRMKKLKGIRGRTPSRKMLPILKAARKKAHSAQAREKAGATLRRLGIRPPSVESPWTPDEDALLGTMPDSEVAVLTGRTRDAVRRRRQKLGRQWGYYSRKRGAEAGPDRSRPS